MPQKGVCVVDADHEVPLLLGVGGFKELRRTQLKRRLIASHNKIVCRGLGRKNNVPAEVLKSGRQTYNLWVVLQSLDRTSIGCIVVSDTMASVV